MYNWSKKNILITESNETEYLVTSFMLQTTKVRCIRVKTVAEALKLCKAKTKHKIDLVIINLDSPEFDGTECAERVAVILTDVPLMGLSNEIKTNLPTKIQPVKKPLTLNNFLLKIDSILNKS